MKMKLFECECIEHEMSAIYEVKATQNRGHIAFIAFITLFHFLFCFKNV